MKKDFFFDTFRDIDPKYIISAAPNGARNKRSSGAGIALIAASLAVIMILAVAVLPFLLGEDPPPDILIPATTVGGDNTVLPPDTGTTPYVDTWEHILYPHPSDTGEEELVQGITYLTSPTFRSSRESGMVSREFRAAAASFAFELANRSREFYEGDGMLVSPLSAMLALAMTANGAEDETLAEMEKVIAGGIPLEKLNQELYNYTSSLASAEYSKINLANSIWVSDSPSFRVNDEFIKTVENTFDADIISANMADRDTYKLVNKWVENETFGMIDGIYSEPIDPLTVMILINALAFDAVWQEQEEDAFQQEGLFNGKDTVKYMNTECDAYIEGENEVGIVKNYRGGHYSFVALLPNAGEDVWNYMNSLDGERFLRLFDNRQSDPRKVNVTGKIPHFKFDCTINLNDVLKAMGMPRAFESSGAQFGALGTSDIGNIFIQSVKQKTFIRLDNSGTRAAAVTAVEMAPESAEPGAEIVYYRVELDRPFVYAIVDNATGLPIFLGVCENIK